MKRYLLTLITLLITTIAIAQSPLWMRYSAISPDGSTIVFEYQGDLYKVNANGGNAQLLTTSDAYDYAPVWSNDGSEIAFSSNRYGNFDVFVMPATGGPAKRITYHSNNDRPASFSPDNKTVYYQSNRLDDVQSANFPVFPEFYAVGVNGGAERQSLTIPVINGKFNKAGDHLLFEDRKGYEFYWRKHHTSSVTRDIWIWNKTTDDYQQLTTFAGEDLYPNWSPDEQKILYTSEEDGTANIWSLSVNNPSDKKQITHFQKNPVRFLTVAANGTMCFGYDGEIYTCDMAGNYKKVNIVITSDDRFTEYSHETLRGGATEMAVSPDAKEIALVVRGEVFVTSVESGTTRRITNTPGQERSVSFSPDGKKILYASERNNIWGIYQTRMVNEKEVHFFNATLLKEDTIISNGKESFQPKYAPDGNRIAYLEERTTLNVYDLKTKKTITVLPADKNYSYSDGDQYFDWSPDGRFLLVQFLLDQNWLGQIGIVNADGSGSVTNLLESGYDNYYPKWSNHGNSMIWFGTKYGLRNAQNSGAQTDVYEMFFNQKAFDRFKLSKEELEILKDQEAKEKDEADKKKAAEAEKTEKNKKDDKSKKTAADSVHIDSVKIDFDDLEERKVRLTGNAAYIADAVLSPDGEQLFYLARFEKDFDIWQIKIRENETKLFMKLNAGYAGAMQMDSTGKNLFLIVDGSIVKFGTDDAARKDIGFAAEMDLNTTQERAYMFEHVWRQVEKKFYVADLHHVDWQYYKDTYSKFLPYINNNFDFSEMVSEMLGELNCSHTGCYYSYNDPDGDQTASLGIYPDNHYTGNGIRVAEVMQHGPLDNATSKIKSGTVITKIDGTEISPETNYFTLLNHKENKPTLLSLYDPATKTSWEETVKPIGLGQEYELTYQRWIKMREAEADSLSKGRVGYVHVRGMDDGSFREVYDRVLGRHLNKDALIVDTRFNGGGWLHDDLCTFLSGKTYVSYVPRGQKVGSDPQQKWTKPSIVLVGESNYSDAHMFPYAYQALGIGKLVGMPIAGTGTAVWWEGLQDPSLVFGIPEVGVVTNDGHYLENNQLEPDIKIANSYKGLISGHDEQLEKAVEEMLKGSKK